MKASRARLAFSLFSITFVALSFVAVQARTVRCDARSYVVRKPVDTRIIDLENPDGKPLGDVKDMSGQQSEKGLNATAPEAPSPKVDTPDTPKPEKTVQKAEAEKAPAPAQAKQSAPQKAPQKASKSTSKPAVKTGVVTGLGLEVRKDGSILVSAKTFRRPGQVTYMRLASPGRLVVDLLGSWTLRGKNVVRVDHGDIKYMVAGQHKDRLRLVVHFTKSVPAGKLSIKKQESGISIIIPAR